jgi:uncharacterized membrane protein YfcA
MNAKTGFWSAVGALAGGFAGAMAGKYAMQERPRYRYAEQRRGPAGTEIEDAMVIGGTTGALIGAFLGGTAAGEEPVRPQLPSRS